MKAEVKSLRRKENFIMSTGFDITRALEDIVRIYPTAKLNVAQKKKKKNQGSRRLS